MSGKSNEAVPSQATATKVVVLFRATGDAPILKQTKFKIGGSEKFAKVIDFLRKQLRRETVFVYINSAFSPNPDEYVMDLFELQTQLVISRQTHNGISGVVFLKGNIRASELSRISQSVGRQSDASRSGTSINLRSRNFWKLMNENGPK